jgi:hypothetical protein
VLEADGRSSLISVNLHATGVTIDERIGIFSNICSHLAKLSTPLLKESTNVYVCVTLSVVAFFSDGAPTLYHMAVFLSGRLCRPLYHVPLLHLHLASLVLPHISH